MDRFALPDSGAFPVRGSQDLISQLRRLPGIGEKTACSLKNSTGALILSALRAGELLYNEPKYIRLDEGGLRSLKDAGLTLRKGVSY